MKQTRLIMGMPITIEVVSKKVTDKIFTEVFSFFEHIDDKFSPFKKASEVSIFNLGNIKPKDFSPEFKLILKLAAETKTETDGYFDVFRDGVLDPSGVVKGWAINEAAKILTNKGYKNFYLDGSGDIQTSGKNQEKKKWRVGIKNPFKPEEIVKVLFISGEGVATSGNYIRGDHIYNPKSSASSVSEIVSLTVIGPNVYEADRFATAAFAMGKKGVNFIEKQKSLEGYQIDKKGVATFTTGFEKYTIK